MVNGLTLDLRSSKAVGAFSSLFWLNRPLKIAGLGDSIMGGDGEPAGQSRVGSWFNKASIYTDGRVIPLRYGYGGVSAVGHRSHPNKNDYQTAKPDVLVYHFGVNDMPATGGSLSSGQRDTIRAAILATANEALAAGASFVVFPEIVFADSKSTSETILHNDWLATLPGIDARYVFMPGFEGLYDPASSTYTGDGTHPNQVASDLLAQKFADWLKPQIWGVRKFRDLVVAAGSAGRLYQKEPMVVPFQSTVGGGSGATSTETLNTSSGLTGNSLVLSLSGDNLHVVHWNGVSVPSYANRWFLTSIRLKASQVGSGRTIETKTYSKGSPDGGIVVFCEGQIDTLGEWGHLLMLNKATPQVTELQLQIFSRELVLSETNSVGSMEFGEIYIHDLIDMAAGVPGLNWNM